MYYVVLRKNYGKKMYVVALITFILAWLQGKRFIIAVMGVFYLFFLTKSELGEKEEKESFGFSRLWELR